MPYLDGLHSLYRAKRSRPIKSLVCMHFYSLVWRALRRDDLELKLARDILVQLDRARPSPNVLEVGRGNVFLLDAHARALLKQLRDL